MKNIFVTSLILLISVCSCTHSNKDRMNELVNSWLGRKIAFPHDMIFTESCKDTVTNFWPFHKDFCIVVYANSVGCLSCRLQLGMWHDFITDCDSILGKQIPVLFYFSTDNIHQISHILRRDNFTYPVCIDRTDSLNILNKFPIDEQFQTFLLSGDNEALAIGNPIHNPKVKELYLNIIQGKEMQAADVTNHTSQTSVSVENVSVSMGHFNWQEEQKTRFVIKNTGSRPLVVQDVNTSCGCTSVSYSKKPVQPGKEIKLDVTYKADHPEHFSKTLTVYCNSESSPIRLTISGDAK